MLLLLAGVAAIMGMLASWASNCCGSTDSSDPMPAVVGLLVAAALGLAGLGLIQGVMRPWLLVAMTAVVPIVCVAGAVHSSDLGQLAPFALLGWAAFALVLRADSMRAWLHHGP